jgi:hypothetical protein
VSLYSLAAWLEQTKWSVALHESIWAYPIIESVHVLVLCLFVGLALVLDFRLLGWSFRKVPVQDIVDLLLPWTIGGFVVMVMTGLLLFYGIPLRTYTNIFFRFKVLFLILAGINVWVFHSGIYKRVEEWGKDPHPPSKARLAGMLSLILWACVIVAGRMIAYNWFDKDH